MIVRIMAWRGENLDILSLLWMGDGGYEMKEVTNFILHMDFVDCLTIRADINCNIDYCNIVIIQYKYSILSLYVLPDCENYQGIIPTVAFPCRLRERKCVMFVSLRGPGCSVHHIDTAGNVSEALPNCSSSLMTDVMCDCCQVWCWSPAWLCHISYCHQHQSGDVNTTPTLLHCTSSHSNQTLLNSSITICQSPPCLGEMGSPPPYWNG